MVLHITLNRILLEVEEDFNRAYSFLRIAFYRNSEPGFAKRHVNNSAILKAAGLKQEGALEINDLMTVGQLENIFREKFGLYVQVSRKSGNIWLETTMTDNWTLKQQNDHGKELSEPVVSKDLANLDEFDYD